MPNPPLPKTLIPWGRPGKCLEAQERSKARTPIEQMNEKFYSSLTFLGPNSSQWDLISIKEHEKVNKVYMQGFIRFNTPVKGKRLELFIV